MLSVAIALAALFAGPFAKPTANAPQISKAEAKAEADRQYDFTFDARLAEHARVERIGYRLAVANAELCPETSASLGIKVGVLSDLRGPYRAAVARKWGETDNIFISLVTAGTPAARAGIIAGDRIVAVDGKPLGVGRSAVKAWTKWREALNRAPAPVRLQLVRAGQPVEVALTPDRTCGYGFVLDEESPDLNAYADGKQIVVTRSILRLAASDDELALVIGHELAHNARHHVQSKMQNARIGLLGGALLDVAAAAAGGNSEGQFMKMGAQMGAGMYSPGFESEADYVGMYFLARAGFATDGIELFWRKFAAEDPRGILTKSSHPPTTQRYLAISATRQEIAGKVASGAALKPN